MHFRMANFRLIIEQWGELGLYMKHDIRTIDSIIERCKIEVRAPKKRFTTFLHFYSFYKQSFEYSYRQKTVEENENY